MKKASLLLPPLLFVCLGLAARSLAAQAWTAFTQYQTPFVFSSVETAAAEPVVPGVVLVLLDGLRLDASRRMPFLNELRARGADLESETGQPSFSLPGRGTLLSGAWQDVHGQTTNMQPRPLAVEHLFQVARRRGVLTALAAGSVSFQLFDPWVDRRFEFPEIDPGKDLPALQAELGVRERTLATALGGAPAGFFMAELISVDEAGHEWGGASPAYSRMAAEVDAVVRRLVGRLDLARTTLLVTSDHGHTDRGGHGGTEPLVTRVPLLLAGAAVRSGTRGRTHQIDVAPTIAVLLGLPIPASNQGRPLLEHLALSLDQARTAAARVEAQRQAFLPAYAARLAEPAPAPATVRSDGGPDPQDVDLAEARLRSQRLGREVRSRGLKAAAFLGMLVLTMAVLSALAGWRQLGIAATAAVLGLLAYRLAFPLFGLGYSMSLLNRDEDLGPFFRHDMLLAALASAVAAAAAGAWRRRRQPNASRLDLARTGWLTGAALVAVFLLRITHAYVGTGLFLTWHMPDMDLLFAFYLDLLALVAVCFAGPLLPLAAWAGAALAGLSTTPRLARLKARGVLICEIASQETACEPPQHVGRKDGGQP